MASNDTEKVPQELEPSTKTNSSDITVKRSDSNCSSGSISSQASQGSSNIVYADDSKKTNGVAVVRRNSSRRSVNSHASSSDGSPTVQRAREMAKEEELIRRRSASVLEVKEHAHSRLKEELLKAQTELQLKDEEVHKLTHVQDQMNVELEDLTASLFEEANKMVQDANVKRMHTEKLLKEAQSKIDPLMAEVTALKHLVMTSTPSMPNRHLHPQIADTEPQQKKKSITSFIKGHRRSTSHHNFSKDVQTGPPLMPQMLVAPPPLTDDRELDPVCFEEFTTWMKAPSVDQCTPFMSHINIEDIQPCLNFANKELCATVFQSVLNNTLTIEPSPTEKNPFPKTCSLTSTSRVCKYRIRVGDSEPWHIISQIARNRITAVCDFIMYVRYITQGLVKSESHEVYWEIIKLRKKMCLARLGIS